MTKKKDRYTCHACNSEFSPSNPHERYCSLQCRLNSRIDKGNDDDCWPWTGATNDRGYGQFYVNGKLKYAHRAAYEIASGVRLRHGRILHSCDNPPCCNPKHLAIGTQADNMADMWSKGRGKLPNLRGIDHPKCKLTEQQVREIKVLISAGTGTRAIGRKYGVSQGAIEMIARGTNWKHI
jgi:hypothetical protein